MSATGIVIGIDGHRGARRAPGLGSVRARTQEGPLRLTRRGRLVATLVLTLVVGALFVVLGGASVATREGGATKPVRVIEVEQGQTLWQIASSVAEPGQTGEMVYRIRELNSLPGSALVEGQELAVPLR